MAAGCLLYYITDRIQFAGDEPTRRRLLLAKIAEAACAGIAFIQLREKDLKTRELEELAREAVQTIQGLAENRKMRTGLLINSRTDIAISVGADGVHLRSDDLPASELRKIWARSSAGAGEKPCIAVSCHSRAEVEWAQLQAADFAVFGPVFEKKNDPRAVPSGLETLKQACQVQIPVLALGGVTLDNAASCIKAGAAGIAAIRLFQENKIEDVARALRAL